MMPHVTGTTRLYGLVGDPLTTAKSPELLNRLFIEQRADAVCVPFAVKDNDLPAFVTGARALGNLSGVLVTMPHKQRMLSFVDVLHPTARQVGAVNVIRCDADGRWVGAIFDGLMDTGNGRLILGQIVSARTEEGADCREFHALGGLNAGPDGHRSRIATARAISVNNDHEWLPSDVASALPR